MSNHEALPPAAPSQKRDPFGCMAGTVTILPGTDLTAPSDDTWNTKESGSHHHRDCTGSQHGADDAR